EVAPAVVRVEGRTVREGEFTPVGVRLVDAAGAHAGSVDLVLNDAFHVISGIEEEPHCTALLPGASTSFAFRPAVCSPDDGSCVALHAAVAATTPLPSDVPW